MGWTRAEYMDEVRSVMDAEGSGRWTDATIRRHLGLAGQILWREILDTASTYAAGTREVYPDNDGLVPLRDLDSGAGDTRQRFYRILTDRNGTGGVLRGDVLYQEAQFQRFQNTFAQDGTSGAFWIQGANLQVLPKTTAMHTVYVSYTPARLDELSADTAEFEFPDGYELAVVYRAAALLLAKGGAEDDAGATMLALSKTIMEDCLGTIMRRTTAPLRIGSFDNASDWGR
jgi:hypothetical protein